jgi:hypothetical protein
MEGIRWGETLHKFVNTIWHFDFGLRIDRLAELNQIYLIPSLDTRRQDRMWNKCSMKRPRRDGILSSPISSAQGVII